MNNPYSRAGGLTQEYLRQQIDQASPAQQIVMLYDGAIKFMLQAKEAIGRNDIQGRHNANRRVIEIVSYLIEILDVDKGGEVGSQLQRIYTFLLRRLMDVDFKNDPQICDEILEHLRILRSSWDQLAKNNVVLSPQILPIPKASSLQSAPSEPEKLKENLEPRFNAVA